MSRSLSATGWSAGGTLLAGFTGSAGRVVVAGGAAVVVSFLVVSFLFASEAGAVTTSGGLVSCAFSVVFGSGAFGASVLAASGTDAVVSSLKSLIVGGGTLAGSGRGIAASIARSAALLRGGSV